MEIVAFWANVATLITLVLTVGALVVTAWQLFVGRKAASAGALIALNESFRQAWLNFSRAADDEARQHAFADVMNLLEAACAIFEDKMFIGRAGKLLEDYLCHVFILIRDSDDARERIQAMIVTEKTFEHIYNFLRSHRKQVRGIQLPGLATQEAQQ